MHPESSRALRWVALLPYLWVVAVVAVAITHAFEGRIAHGMLFQSWFTRLLGMEFAGPGTLYLVSRPRS